MAKRLKKTAGQYLAEAKQWAQQPHLAALKKQAEEVGPLDKLLGDKVKQDMNKDVLKTLAESCKDEALSERVQIVFARYCALRGQEPGEIDYNWVTKKLIRGDLKQLRMTEQKRKEVWNAEDAGQRFAERLHENRDRPYIKLLYRIAKEAPDELFSVLKNLPNDFDGFRAESLEYAISEVYKELTDDRTMDVDEIADALDAVETCKPDQTNFYYDRVAQTVTSKMKHDAINWRELFKAKQPLRYETALELSDAELAGYLYISKSQSEHSKLIACAEFMAITGHEINIRDLDELLGQKANGTSEFNRRLREKEEAQKLASPEKLNQEFVSHHDAKVASGEASCWVHIESESCGIEPFTENIDKLLQKSPLYRYVEEVAPDHFVNNTFSVRLKSDSLTELAKLLPEAEVMLADITKAAAQMTILPGDLVQITEEAAECEEIEVQRAQVLNHDASGYRLKGLPHHHFNDFELQLIRKFQPKQNLAKTQSPSV